MFFLLLERFVRIKLPIKISPVVWYTKCRGIYETLLFQHPWREQYGRILRHSRATNGFAGLYPGKKRRREVSVSRKRSRSLKVECAGLVVGVAVFIVENATLDKFH